VSSARMVAISRQEGEMIVRVVEAITGFAKDFPLEFYSYCPMKRWEEILRRVGASVSVIEEQLAAQADPLIVPADALFATMDLEECVSGARDARLSSAKTALIISAGAAIGETFFGLSWLGLPAYIVSLAIVLGKPITAYSKESPAEPFRVDSVSGSKNV